MGTQIYKTKDGVRCPSVTTIISKNLGWNKEVLLAWYAKMFKAGKDPTERKQKAATIGDLCHLYISSYIYDQNIEDAILAEYPMDAILLAERGLEEYKKLKKKHGIEIIASEKGIVSEQYKYGGTIDLWGIVNGRKALPDIKTSPNVYSDHIIQIGAYDNLLIENDVFEPEDYYVIHISKDPLETDERIVELVPIEAKTVKLGWEVFKQLRWLHDIQNQLKIAA